MIGSTSNSSGKAALALAMPPASLVSSPPPACCLQLHRLLRPAALLPSPPRLRLRPLRADSSPSPSPSPDAFAGWSDGDEQDEQDKSPGSFRGILGPSLAGLFFVAGLTFAAISFRSSAANGPKAQIDTLSTNTQEAPYSTDNTCKEDCLKDAQVSLPTDSKDEASLDDEAHSSTDLLPVQVNATVEGSTEHETHRPLQNSELVPPDKYVPSEDEVQAHNLVASDGAESLVSPLSNSTEPAIAAYDSPGKLYGVGPSEGPPNVEDTLNCEITLPENQHLGETLTSDTMLDSGDATLIQEISDTAASSDAEDKDTEQNPELHRKNGISPSRMPDYTEYGHADQMLSFGSNDVSTEANKPGNGVETLASNQNEGTNELENQNNLYESTTPDKSFASSGIPAPTLLSAALRVRTGQIMIPAAVDPAQASALAALQVLKVIEPDAQAGDLCTRREYARWLVVASNCLSRNTSSKVYPAMYIENVTELAFDDITPEDFDFPFIQGLAEAGLISSKLSRSDMNVPQDVDNLHNLFSPECPVSRQDLVSWKMALDKRQLPEVDKISMYKASGYMDVDKINAAAWPFLVADLHAGDQSITALAFGFTRLFQPDKPVTKGQAALALSTGDSADVVMEELARIEAEKIAEAAVNAHGELVAQVEKDLNATFERELTREREKIETLEKLAEEARVELDKLRAERVEENNALIRGRASVESEMEVLSKLRSEVEEQLQSVLSKKVEISFEKNRIEKLQKEIENDRQAVVQLQYELEVERKALSMARAWAEDEAKKAREHARALEEARNQWERHGIKVVVERGLEDDASAGVTWANAGKEHQVDEAINRAGSLLEKLKSMSAEIKVRSCRSLERVIQHVRFFISILKQGAAEATQRFTDLGAAAALKAKKKSSEAQDNVYAFGSTIGDKSKRVVEDCKEGLGKFVHRFKTD
uniref:SLH domain-containing protein n=1 Tax=Oryza punctata TaxID=4537 RepID=A0A0E0KLY6_ORYPU